MHGSAVEHARLPDREIGDVDHLLDFAVTFLLDLSGFQRHQRTEGVFFAPQRVADAPHQLAPPRRGHGLPCGAGCARRAENRLV